MILAALDFEFGFHGRAFDYTTVEPVCGVLLLADGRHITACPKLGRPWSLLAPYLANPGILIATHHGGDAERRILRHQNLPLPDGRWWDTEIAERVLHIVERGDLLPGKKGDGRYTLLNCLKRRNVLVRDSEAKKALQERIGRLEFADSELPAICQYCADDCADTLRLARRQLGEFRDLPGMMTSLFTGLLLPHYMRVADMTAKGLPFDRESYEALVKNADRLLAGKQVELKRLGFAGEFNYLREKLTVAPQNLNVVRTFDRLGLHNILDALKPYKSDNHLPAGQRRRSLQGIFKEGHKSPVPFIRAVKDYHDLIELFSRDWTQFIDSDGRIRPAAVFPGTSSYRTQQHMPHPLMLPYFARPLFHARPSHALLEIDFKSQEAGLAAEFYGDEKMLRIYNEFVLCMYCEIGAAMGIYPCVPGQPADPETDAALRGTVKTALLALQYGGGIKPIMEQTNLPRERAAGVIKQFERVFPDLHEGKQVYLNHVRHNRLAVNRAGLTRGYRPYAIKQGQPRDTALSYTNFPVQSAGAAVLMLTLAELPAWTNPVLTMHDAVLFEVPQDAVEEVAGAAEAAMASALSKLFPRLRCRCERQAAYRYHKKTPSSLHTFCRDLGLDLPPEVGWSGKLAQ